MAVSKYLSIITLEVDGLNDTINRVAEWTQKQNPSMSAYKSLTADLKTHTNCK